MPALGGIYSTHCRRSQSDHSDLGLAKNLVIKSYIFKVLVGPILPSFRLPCIKEYSVKWDYRAQWYSITHL